MFLGSGRFPVIQNRSPQSLAAYQQQQRLRTPNYQNNGTGGIQNGMNNRRPVNIAQQKTMLNQSSSNQVSPYSKHGQNMVEIRSKYGPNMVQI